MIQRHATGITDYLRSNGALEHAQQMANHPGGHGSPAGERAWCRPGKWLLLLHTDGVSARFAVESLPEFTSLAPGSLAAAVLAGRGRSADDATVVVARPQR